MNENFDTDLLTTDIMEIDINNSSLISNLTKSSAANHSECYGENQLEAVGPITEIILIIVFWLTALFAMLSNAYVFIVMCSAKKEAQNNFPLLMMSLAISDILMATFCVPYTYSTVMYGRWIYSSNHCKVAQCIQLMSAAHSSFILSITGFERYLAIVHPLNKFYYWIRDHTRLLIIISWLLAIAYAGIWIKTCAVPFTHKGQTYFTCEDPDVVPWMSQVSVVINYLTFAGPLTGIVISNGGIIFRLVVGDRVIRANQVQNNPQDKHYEVICILSIMVMVYLVCWAPIKNVQVVQEFFPETFDYCSREGFNREIIIKLIIYWLAMFSTCANPIVYSFMSKNFRKNEIKLRKRIRLWIFSTPNEDLALNQPTSDRSATISQTADTSV